MKKLSLILLLSLPVCAMEDVDIEKGLVLATKDRSSARIAAQLSEIIFSLGDEIGQDEDQYKNLIIQFFAKESIRIENNIMPHLKQKLRDSDTEIDRILKEDDRGKLETFISKIISDSIEDAMKEKEDSYNELKEIADSRLKKTRYALATAIVSAVGGCLAVFFGAYFGKA